MLPSDWAVAEQGYGFLFLLDDLDSARFDDISLWKKLKKKTILLWENLIFDNAWVVFSLQTLVYSELEMGGIFKKQWKLR